MAKKTKVLYSAPMNFLLEIAVSGSVFSSSSRISTEDFEEITEIEWGNY